TKTCQNAPLFRAGMNGILYRGHGGLFSSRQPFARWLWDGTKVQHHYCGSPTAQGGVNDGSPLCLPASASLLAQARRAGLFPEP
ncbi:MAG: hypothetical protein PVJ69_07555, partial [Desulfobacteraceae bacterium]